MATLRKEINEFPLTKTSPGQGGDVYAVDEDQGGGVFKTKKVPVGSMHPVTVETVAQLRAMKTPGNVRYTVQLLGYYSKGDGGGGPDRHWAYGAAPATYVDNGGSIIVPTGGDGSSAWLFPNTETANLAHFGGKPASVDAAFRNDVALASAIAWAANTSRIVEIPCGEYRFDNTIVLPYNITLKGADILEYYVWIAQNEKTTTLKFMTDVDGITFTADYYKNTIKNIQIVTDVSPSTKTAIKLDTGRWGTGLAYAVAFEGLWNQYQNIMIRNFRIGIKMYSAYAWNQTFEKLLVFNCRTGIDLEARSLNNSTFRDIYINRSESDPRWTHTECTGFILRAGGQVVLDSFMVENQGTSFAFAAPNSDIANVTDQKIVYASNVYSEAFLSYVVDVDVPGRFTMEHAQLLYGFYPNAFFRIGNTTDERYVLIVNDVKLTGHDSSNRYSKYLLLSSRSPSLFHAEFTQIDVSSNGFEELYVGGSPPNKIEFTNLNNDGEEVKLIRDPENTTKMLLITGSQYGALTASAALIANNRGGNINLNAFGKLTFITPMNARNRPKIFDHRNILNGLTFDVSVYSGAIYYVYGVATAIAMTLDFSKVPHGTTFTCSDLQGAAGSVCTVTISGNVIVVPALTYATIEKCYVEISGGAVVTKYRVVASGSVNAMIP